MDEILASIRRIIESGDEPSGKKVPPADRAVDAPLRGSSVQAEPAPLPRFDVHYLSPKDERDDEISADDLREIEATDPGEDYTAVHTIDEGHAPDHEAEPRSDASVEEWVGSSAEGAEIWSERETEEAWSAEPQPSEPAVPPPAGNENAVRLESDGEPPPADHPASARNFSFEFDDEAFEAELQSDEAWYGSTPSAREAGAPARVSAPAPQPEARMPESVIDGASALLSAQAGDQVAAAFDDLTRAIRDGQMRSMEDMAREMLRPMLQEWLDDNLPRLVERLVRDEIERIARGPRR